METSMRNRYKEKLSSVAKEKLMLAFSEEELWIMSFNVYDHDLPRKLRTSFWCAPSTTAKENFMLCELLPRNSQR